MEGLERRGPFQHNPGLAHALSRRDDLTGRGKGAQAHSQVTGSTQFQGSYLILPLNRFRPCAYSQWGPGAWGTLPPSSPPSRSAFRHRCGFKPWSLLLAQPCSLTSRDCRVLPDGCLGTDPPALSHRMTPVSGVPGLHRVLRGPLLIRSPNGPVKADEDPGPFRELGRGAPCGATTRAGATDPPPLPGPLGCDPWTVLVLWAPGSRSTSSSGFQSKKEQFVTEASGAVSNVPFPFQLVRGGRDVPFQGGGLCLCGARPRKAFQFLTSITVGAQLCEAEHG